MIKEGHVDHSWDYRDADTKEYTHGLHSYPAMMIPQVARRLIERYGSNAEVLLDPFVGSGSVLVEGLVNNQIKESYGVEINPLAILISRVKTTPLNADKLEAELSALMAKAQECKRLLSEGKLKLETPRFKNINFWFSPKVVQGLTLLKESILNISDAPYRDFFLLSFSEIIRDVSYTRNSEFKLYRMPQDKIATFNPDVMAKFKLRALDNIKRIKCLSEKVFGLNKKCKVSILFEDTRNKTSIPDSCVDLLVTSPPYGDSRTTVAYGQFSRLSSQWLGFDEDIVRNVDKRGLGGVPAKSTAHELPSKHLNGTLSQIQKKDELRSKEVLSFFLDFNKCITEIDRVMKPGSHVCMVVGNRTVKEVQIPTDKIIAELFVNGCGYEHMETIIREIPSKKMPKRNSPTNEKGKTVSTMNNEYIVVLKKPSKR